ncbi:MAG: sterol desaturase family protein [Myxococcaceae bacterium]
MTLLALLGVPLGLLYANLVEWLLHRFLLHGVGKNPASFWSFHWHDHHRASRRAQMFDAQYVEPLFTWGSPQLKELVSVAAITLAHALLIPFFPVFGLTVTFAGVRYYLVHRRAHLDPAWARRHLPWHVDHHLGRDQNANWCATAPWFDVLMGTRKVYTFDAEGRPLTEERVTLGTVLARAWRPQSSASR